MSYLEGEDLVLKIRMEELIRIVEKMKKMKPDRLVSPKRPQTEPVKERETDRML